MTLTRETPTRRDARRNRQLLLEAADEILRRDGMSASLDAIARRAGVGNATLYRHFPTRESLYTAVFTEALDRWEPVRQRILAIADPWVAITTYIAESCTIVAANRGLMEMCKPIVRDSPEMAEFCEREDREFGALLRRAQEAGAVRADLEMVDLRLLMVSLHQVTLAATAVSPDAWRRHLALVLDSLRPHEGAQLPPERITQDELMEILYHLTTPH
jgi:AcrR family transcriptional regulator